MAFSRSLPATAAAVTGAAVLGGLATDVDSDWFRTLRLPSFYPPPATFGIVWTALYAGIAWATADGLDRARAAGDDEGVRHIRQALAANLALNAAWTPIFFRAHRPGVALAEIVALEVSTLRLMHTVGQHSRRGAAGLAPYAAWNAFAGLLTAAIVRANRRP